MFRSSGVQEFKRRGRKSLAQRAAETQRFAEKRKNSERKFRTSVKNDSWLPRSLHYAARRAKLRRGGKSRAAPVGMTEKCESRPKSTARNGCATRRKPKRAGRARPYKGKSWLAEEPAEEGLLPGGAVYFGYGFG